MRGISGVAANSAVNTRKLRTGKPINVEAVVTRNSPEPTEKGKCQESNLRLKCHNVRNGERAGKG